MSSTGSPNDDTRRIKTEANERLLLQAVENSREALVVTEAQLELPGPRIAYVNQAFTRMTGYASEEVIGQTPRMFQGPKTNRRVIERMLRRLAQGKSFEGETVNYRKDGSSFILAWTVAPIFGVNGDVVNWISTQYDVTARRRLERETLDISAREQQRIGGELHDSLQQQLVGTAMHAKLLARALAARNDDQAEAAEQLYQLTQESVQSLRTVMHGVAPVQPNETGLMVALEGLTKQVHLLYGVACSFSYETPVLLQDHELASQLYYIAQEAAGNAAKHAQANMIELSLVRVDGHVALTVRDDGGGFDARASEHASQGMGLQLMAYRARLVNAEFEVSSALGEGTTVTCLFVAD